MDGPSFVKLIEQKLKSKRISKTLFYEGTGISSATFSQWRNGIYSPSASNIKRIEQFLGMQFDFAKKGKPTSKSELTEEEMRYIMAFRRADAGSKSVIKRILADFMEGGDQNG